MKTQTATVEINNIHKQFKEKKVIKGLSFQIKSGQIFGLLGSNGSGKTTTIRILTGLAKADTGTVYVSGQDVFKNPISIKNEMGIVPDADELLDDLTCMEFLNFIGSIRNIPKETQKIRIKEWLNIFNLWEQRDFLLGSYSHGMRKKVQIISSLLHQPKLLIIDEPTNGLDPDMIILLQELMLQIQSKDISILLSTHNLSFAEKVCDYVTLIKDGISYREGEISEVLNDTQSITLDEAYAKLSNARDKKVEVNELLTNW